VIEITGKPIKPEVVINAAKTTDSGCVVTYVGLIRDSSNGKSVLSVEYQDVDGQAVEKLKKLADEIKMRFPVNDISMCHRTGKLKVGDINLVFAFSCGHRQEGFAACQYAIDKFKEFMPTKKHETYKDGSICTEW